MSETESLDIEFDKAAAHVACGNQLSNEALLKLYGLYKQATAGPCTAFRPSFFDRKARAKWAAWNDLEGMPSDAAKQEYIHMVSCLSPGWQATAAASEKKGQGGPGGPVFSSLAGCMEESEAGPPLGSLHLLASEGDTSAVAFLLDNSADADSRDADGCTALHWAADRGSLEVVHLLLERGANINALDADGQTPLHYAAISDQKEVCEALLKAGADADLRDSSGKRPQDVDALPRAWNIWPTKS